MKKEYGDYVEDILDSLMLLKNLFTEWISRNLKETFFAVIRGIEIIGEATKSIPDSIRDRYPDIPWKDMAGMRDKVIHGYFGVDSRVVWETASHRIPQIKPLIQKVLEDLDSLNG
ncbi:MAG: DUF86 domain-containing protein [Halobacteriota archaeon]